jgi:hypothetical protein
MSKEMMTLKELEEAGHLGCITELVELKKESNEFFERWSQTSIQLSERVQETKGLETLAWKAINEAKILLSDIASGRKKASAAQVTNALDSLNQIKWDRTAPTAFSPFSQWQITAVVKRKDDEDVEITR